MKRYEIDDPEIIKFAEMINGELNVIQGPVQILDMFPWIVPYVPTFIKNKWMKVDFLEESREEFFEFCRVSLIIFAF